MLTLVRSMLTMSCCIALTALAQTPTAATSGPTPLMAKWNTSLYGFVDLNTISDSTQSYNTETAANGAIARPGTFAGSHRRLMYSVRNSRLGFRLGAPEVGGVKASAVIEIDLNGNQPPTATEAQFFTNPTLRVRHAYLKMETEYVDILLGQTWALMGWQPLNDPNTVGLQGVPGALYSRTPQIRVSHLFKAQPVGFEVAVAALRPPQRDSGWPDGQAGIRLVVDGWKGVHTMGATGTALDAASLGFTGALRGFAVREFTAAPVNNVTTTATAYSIDLLLPVIPGTLQQRGGALTVQGEFSNGSGFSDQFTSLTGGVGFPATVPGGGAYTPNIDNGMVTFLPDGTLHTIDWRGIVVGAQYYLPPDGRFWISSNYSNLYSANAAMFGSASSIFNHSWWADGNLFVDLTPAVRLGLEYAYFSQTYVDGVNATNHRFQLDGYFMF